MPRQQELSKCHPPDTQFEANDGTNDDDVPICEHLRLWSTINDHREEAANSVCTPHLSLLQLSSEAPMLLLPDWTNTAGFISKHIKSWLCCTECGSSHMGHEGPLLSRSHVGEKDLHCSAFPQHPHKEDKAT